MKSIDKIKYIYVLLFLLLHSNLFSQEPQWEIFFENMQGPIAVDPYDSNIIYIASSLSGESGFWKTTDGGSTWNKYTDGWGMSNPEMIFIIPHNTEIIYTVGGQGVGILKSTDGGNSWKSAEKGIRNSGKTTGREKIQEHDYMNIKDIAYDEENDIYYVVNSIVMFYGIFKSEDGDTWELVDNTAIGDPKCIETGKIRDIDGEVKNAVFAGTSSGFWVSTNNGNTWNQKNNGLSSTYIFDLAKVYNSNTIYAATDNGIFKTTDNGENWFSVNDSLTSQLAFTGGLEVSQTDTNTIFAGAHRNFVIDSIITGGIYLSRNGGDTWQQFNNGLSDTAQNYNTYQLFLDNQTNTLYSWITTLFNTYSDYHIYRMSNAVITDITEQPKEHTISSIQLQAAPNPFNSQTNLIYSIPVEGRMTLKIYDILGREVLTLLDNTITTGKQSIYWNGTNSNGEKVPSGVYFARLEMKAKHIKTEAVTTKLMMLK